MDPQKPPQQSNIPPARFSLQEGWEAIAREWARAQIGRAHGHLLALFETDEDLPLSRHLLLTAIAAFFAFFILWANFATLDEVARGQGKIIPSSDVQAVQLIEPGIIEEFFVKEGDKVEAGQVLLRLSDIEASSDLGAGQSRYLSLQAAIARLQAQAEGKDSIEFPEDVRRGAAASVTEESNAFAATREQLTGQESILRQQLTQREQEAKELESRIADMRSALELQQQEKNLIAPLVERGSAPKLELLQLERGIQEKTTELNSAQSSLPRAQSAVAEAQARLADLQTSARAKAQSELAAKLAEMNEIKERLGALKDRKTRTEIKSPVKGTIQEISVNTIGGVARAGEDIVRVVPDDDQLIVEARIKPSDRAFIYPGQKAMVKLTAYDFSIYGGLKSEVADISADTIEDEKGNSFYRVRLRTLDTQLRRKGQVLPIVPGMVASVDILTGQKTVMQYLLKPLIKTLDTAMTER